MEGPSNPDMDTSTDMGLVLVLVVALVPVAIWTRATRAAYRWPTSVPMEGEVCKHYGTPGGCRRGKRCKMLHICHDGSLAVTKQAPLTEMREADSFQVTRGIVGPGRKQRPAPGLVQEDRNSLSNSLCFVRFLAPAGLG